MSTAEASSRSSKASRSTAARSFGTIRTNGNQGGAPSGAVRDGDWKLIEWYEDGSRELFNIREDVGEHHNRAAEMPDKVRDLAFFLDGWRRAVGAVMPTLNGKTPPRPPS
jgi:arylsulfatase A